MKPIGDLNMIMGTRNRLIFSVCLMLVPAGCCTSGGRVPDVAPSSAHRAPVSDPIESLHHYQDPRLRPDQQRAIQVAVTAVHGTDPSVDMLGQLRFNISDDQNGYWVQMWRVTPGTVNPPGNFTSIQVSRDYTIVRVVGGA